VLCRKIEQATTDASGAQGLAAAVAGAVRESRYTYNRYGQLLTADGPRTDLSDIATYAYYADDDPDLGKRGNLASITNALGQFTSITAYNAHGQPLTIVDPNGLATSLTYDARQRLTARSVGGEITSYTYDGAGQLTNVTLPDGSSLAYTYDAARRLTGLSDNLGNRIAYTLDAMGNRTQEQVFDPASNLAQTRSRVYDGLSRLSREIGAQSQTTQYAYDNQGNVTSVTDPLNRVTAHAYDALNRLLRVTDPGSGQTQYGYNGLDQLASVTDPRGQVTTYAYDGLSNLSRQVSPDTGTTQNTYDEAGNLLTQTDAKGQVTAYAYDALNRVTSIAFQDGTQQTYAYDQGANGIGRLSSITETDAASAVTGLTQHAYDQKGRVVSEVRTINGTAYTTAYTYDAAGRLAALTYPSGRTVSYSFDALGRIAQIATTAGTHTQVVVSNVAYQPFGGVKSYTLGNGQTYTRSYDLDGRIASYTLGANPFNLGFDAASRITSINTNNYGYDALDRLNQAVLLDKNYGYAYDAVGNRLSKTNGTRTDLYTYASTNNQLALITTVPGSAVRVFQTDPNGATVSDGANQYTYDARGRLAQASSAQGFSSYQVNALGQRVRKSTTAGDTVFHYDSRGRLIAESDSGGALKREYLYLNDIPVAVIQ